jgi:hypothetical protein
MTPYSLAFAACGVLAVVQVPAGPVAKPQEPVAVTAPLELLEGRPVLSVRVNGAGPFRLLVDPLAPTTRLDEALVEELRLRRAPQAKGQLAPTYRVDLQIDTMSILGVGVEPADMAPLVPGFRPASRARGVLGADAWRGRLATFDFGAGRVTFARGALPTADGVAVFSLDPSDLRTGIPVVVAGNRLTATLDLLFGGGLVLPETMAPRTPLVKGPVLARTMPTRVNAILVSEAQLMGDLELESVVVMRPALFFSRQILVPTLGTAWLTDFVVVIDGENRRARLVRRPPS